ncbi:alpha/beta fold hydrolase [Nioella aestuarii]|uniref:alpha/beta fold hydrolase n=1 Tax=Nioella aestuarii TaxID=1662864 RepID=UPI003D7FDA09
MAIPLIAGAAALALGGSYLGARLNRRRIEDLRSNMPGRLVSLSQGHTHAEWHGPQDGPVLVCVHGLSTPSFVWGPLLPHLTDQGYRVLTYDLYGRGYSDRPPGRQDAGFFLRQLKDLLDQERVSNPFTLMGYSMGGAISGAFAQAYPDRVSRLILLAPAGLGLHLGRFSEIVAKSPIIGDWMMEVLGAQSLRGGYGEGDGVDPVADAITNRALDELAVEGTLRAILSAQRGILSDDQSSLHTEISASDIPVLAVWGAQDTVIPITCRKRLETLNPSARQITLTDADHRLTYTHAAQVAEAIGPA